MKKAPEQVKLEYEEVGGKHTFRSIDYFGVYVADDSFEVAFNKMTEALEALVQIKTGQELEYVPEMSSSEFKERLGKSTKSIPHPSVIHAASETALCA